MGAGTPAASTVARTVLGDRERSAELGALPPEGIVRMPGHSLVTVTIQR
jgi:hypothetical protein